MKEHRYFISSCTETKEHIDTLSLVVIGISSATFPVNT